MSGDFNSFFFEIKHFTVEHLFFRYSLMHVVDSVSECFDFVATERKLFKSYFVEMLLLIFDTLHEVVDLTFVVQD